MQGNDFMIWLLSSPFHRLLSRGFLLVTVTGCKSGKTYTTPVNYLQDGKTIWVISTRPRTWWRNLTGGAGLSVRLARQEIAARAEVIQDEIARSARGWVMIRIDLP
jgi:deazaflavin-dependent oxidoreductase (nitroreductase family)